MTLYLLNTTIIPSNSEGIWEAKSLPLASAKKLLAEPFISGVGHESTAGLMTELLGTLVPNNRIQVEPVVGDQLLCFKLRQRAPEGAILSKEQIQEIGFEWVLLTYHGTLDAAMLSR